MAESRVHYSELFAWVSALAYQSSIQMHVMQCGEMKDDAACRFQGNDVLPERKLSTIYMH